MKPEQDIKNSVIYNMPGRVQKHAQWSLMTLATLGLSVGLSVGLTACGGDAGTASQSGSTTTSAAVPPAAPLVTAAVTATSTAAAPPPADTPSLVPIANDEGSALTISTTGSIDKNNAFFKPLGNGRSCATCHQESQGWSVRPPLIQDRFTQSNGEDPIFRLNDGATSPTRQLAHWTKNARPIACY